MGSSAGMWLLCLGLGLITVDAASKRGTPIDLFGQTMGSFSPFVFNGFDILQRNVRVVNDRATIRVDLPSTYTVSGGGLTETYVPLQFHLHWDREGSGSEHAMFGEKYAAELHVVMRKQSMTTTQAINSGDHDALAVLGFFLKEVSNENARLRDFIGAVSMVQNYEMRSNISITNNFNLMRLLYNGERNYGEFFRYSGSLTTVPYSEIVRWTVFTAPIEISTDQLAVIRGVSAGGFVLPDNYRPIQSLDGRTVQLSGPRIAEEQARRLISPQQPQSKPDERELHNANTGIPKEMVVVVFVVLSVICLASVAGVIYLARSIKATKRVS